MRDELLDLLACPSCYQQCFDLLVDERDTREIREGTLRCSDCGEELPIRNGVVHALHHATEPVLREARGWVEMLDVPEKQHEFRDEWILSLPFLRPELTPDQESVLVWNSQGRAFFQMLDRFDWRGKRVLEIGASRCWGVAELARRGALAVGLDILTHRYIGLDTADIWFAAERIYFERVLGDMHRLPFEDGSFDFIVATASLHHTDRLDEALREAERVLRADGRAIFVNEPVVPDGIPAPDLSGTAEVQHGIIETRPTWGHWLRAFSSAGFVVERLWLEGDLQVVLRKMRSWDGPLTTLFTFLYGLFRFALFALRRRLGWVK